MSDRPVPGELDELDEHGECGELDEGTLTLIAALRAVPVPDPGEEYGRLLARKIEERAVFTPGGTGFADERGSAGPGRAGGVSAFARAAAIALAAVLALALLVAPRARIDRPAGGDSQSPEASGLLAGLEALSGEGGRSPWELREWSAAAPASFEGDIEESAWIPFEAADPSIDAALESLSVEEEATLLSALESAIRSVRDATAVAPPEPA